MTALISPCGKYRYVLTREIPQPVRWVKPALFIMLNPSTADATKDDPTIRRCIAFAKREGCTKLTVVNLFALRATDPKQLKLHKDPIGPENDRVLDDQLLYHKNTSGIIVAAWGAHRFAFDRADYVASIYGGDLKCLGTTAKGDPRHPLYIRSDQPLEDFHGY